MPGPIEFAVGDIVEPTFFCRTTGIGIVTYVEDQHEIYLNWIIVPGDGWKFGHKHGDVHMGHDVLRLVEAPNA